MDILGRFARLDSALQRGLDNSFAAVFGGSVVPAEIEELLKQEAEDNIVHTYEGSIEAPNMYLVHVSTKDMRNLRDKTPDLPEYFADRMARYCRNQGWSLEGPVVVQIGLDTGLRTGQLRADSKSSANPRARSVFRVPSPSSNPVPTEYPPHGQESDLMNSPHDPHSASADRDFPAGSAHDPNTEMFPGAGTAAAGADDSADGVTAATGPTVSHPAESRASTTDGPTGPVVSLLLQDGSSRTYYVHEGSNIIGRSTDSDFRLPDTGVSRQHAEITWDGQDAVLVDLHSTNGTTVNDTPVENWLLADGDVITVGHSHIEVRITGTNRNAHS